MISFACSNSAKGRCRAQVQQSSFGSHHFAVPGFGTSFQQPRIPRIERKTDLAIAVGVGNGSNSVTKPFETFPSISTLPAATSSLCTAPERANLNCRKSEKQFESYGREQYENSKNSIVHIASLCAAP